MSQIIKNIDSQVYEAPTLMTIRQFTVKHSFMTENSIRWLIFKGEIDECLVRLSRRIFIDEKKFFEFLSKRGV